MTNAHARLALLLLAALLCGAAATRAQGPAPREAPATVEGRVTDGEDGLPGVSVVLLSFRSPGRNPTAARAKTDHEGRYRLTGVPPGRYHVLPAAPAHVLHDPSQTFPPGRPLALSAGETVRDIDFRLTRGGVITGRVTDADGQPVVSEQVHLTLADKLEPHQPSLFTQQHGLLTDDRGVYRAYGLPAGRYRVSVGQDGSGSVRFSVRRFYRRTFHPDAAEESQGRVVEVSPGAEATDVDITVGRAARTYTAAGRFVGPDGRPAPGVPVGVGPVNPQGETSGAFGGGWTTNARGEFLLEGLAPGRYVVFVMQTGELSPETYSEPVEFTVSDADVSGIEVRLRRGAAISGVVSVEGTTDRAARARILGQLRLAGHLEPTPGKPAVMNYQNTRVAPDGSFRLAGLRPGRVRLGLGWPQTPNVTLARVELNGAEQRDAFEVAEGAQVSNVRVVVSYGTASVRGQVNLVNGTLAPDARLVVFARRLQPGEDARQPGAGRGVQVDARGRFLLEGLPAGEYEFSARVFPSRGSRPNDARQQVFVPEGGEVSVTLTLDLSNP